MQDIPAASIQTSEQSALLKSPTWDTTSVETAAFSDLLAIESTRTQASDNASAAPQPQTQTQAQAQPQVNTATQHAQDATQRANAEARNRSEQAKAARAAKDDAEETAKKVDAAEKDETPEMIDAHNNLQDMKDVAVDMESFQAMKPQLDKYGLSKEDIAALERKVGSEKGLTWGELVTAISKKMQVGPKTVELTSQQQQKLMTFFQKLGFSAPEAQRMVGDLASGNSEQINAAVQERLTTLPQDKLASLNKDELDAFNQLIDKMRGQAKAEDRALIRVVGKAMENAMDKARRMAQDQVADKQTATAGAAKTLAQTASNVNTDVSKAAVYSDATPVAEQLKAQKKDAEKLLETLSTDDQLKARVAKAEDSLATGTKLSKDKDADAFMKQDSGKNDKAWNEFFEKLRLDDTSSTLTTKTETAKEFANVMGQVRSAKATATAPLTRTEAPRVLKQVENALLQNLSGGGKRLTLQLNPEQLGSISLALSVKNNEVSATIRTDTAEAGKMIADQIESLRQSLEEQGLKVNKLEVQTQLQGGDQHGWQGLANEEKAFQQGMWGRMRQNFAGNGTTELSAAQLSEMAREAILSGNGNGLHVVA